MKTAALLLLLSSFAGAADALAEAQAAMTGNDASAKKTALKALGAKDAGAEEAAIGLLLGALSDRQAGEAAAAALKARTGASPKGGTWRTGHEAEAAKAWQDWYADEQQKKKLTDLEKKGAKPVAKPAEPTPAEETKPTEAKPEKAVVLPEDLGRIDRIIIKAGGSMLCYIQSRRTDADGTLILVRIIHPEGGGEEILPAALISRVDEDIR